MKQEIAKNILSHLENDREVGENTPNDKRDKMHSFMRQSCRGFLFECVRNTQAHYSYECDTIQASSSGIRIDVTVVR